MRSFSLAYISSPFVTCISHIRADERLENFILTKFDRPVPNRPTPADVLGQHMIDASSDIGATPYGKMFFFSDIYRKIVI